MLILLDPEEYDWLVDWLERKPPAEPEDMPKLRKLMSMPSPFAKESNVRSDV